jgi:DNA-binding NtrC family response regulator
MCEEGVFVRSGVPGSRMKILLVDDDRDFRWTTGNMLESAGYRVIHAGDGEEALSLIEKDIPHLILLDYRMQRMNGLDVAAAMRQRIPGIPVIMITAYPAIDSAVKALRMGVYDYVTKPFDNNDLLFTIKRALEKKDLMDEVANLRYILSERASLYESMGKSDPIKKLVRQVEKVAPTSFTVLIEGESGTGKELVARSIHNLSRVKNGPFVAVDCGAIPETLIETELFGCRKGAFTGAHTDKPGQFELADRGTLFLDEVGNLPYTMQQKLLRTIQERVVQRVGGKKPVEIDVRIVAAANRSLEKGVESERFRPDLFYRLTEFTLRIPPLRERKEDIPYLAKKFMDQLEGELNKKCAGFSREALVALSSYHWPGNVRELKNVIGQAVLLCEDHALIQPQHMTFRSHLIPVSKGGNPDAMEMIHDGKKSLNELVTSYVDLVEKKIIEAAMTEFDGNKSRVAKRLKVDYKTLLRKIKALGIG